MKRLLVLTLLCSAPIGMASVGPGSLWKNDPVDQNIKDYFKIYFVEGKEKYFAQEMRESISKALYAIPELNGDRANYNTKINDLMRQFAVNVMHIERTPHGDKERNKAIDIINKNIDAHNKEVDKNKREIKNLIKSKSNPVETLGGLAALIYEYSDRDPKLKLFWRQIALRGNGYFKEYFLYGQKDEEKINQEPNSFFQIKTQRPKSWSSLVGLGNDYVDKRGWLKYSYDMLKYPIVIGGLGYAASRNSTTLKEALTQGKEYVGKGVKALHKKYRDVTGATRRDEEMKKRDEEIDEMVLQQERLEMESLYKPSLWEKTKKGFDRVRKNVSDRIDTYRRNRDLTWDQNREQNALENAERDYKKEKKLAKKEQERLEEQRKQFLWLQNSEQEALEKAEHDHEKAVKKINKEKRAEQEKRQAAQEKQLATQNEYMQTNI